MDSFKKADHLNPEESKSLGHKTIVCPSCLGAIVVSSEYPKKPTRFCIYCGSALYLCQSEHGAESTTGASSAESSFAATLVPGHLPEKDPIQFQIGPYQIIKKIGKGGMGEVFLAYDTSCGRRIALKRIRADLTEHKALRQRFLKEARITSQLNHPAIIPIYSIHTEGDLIYYTMPYVKGETLKQLLREAKVLEKKGKHPSFGSIPSLIRHFITICQAIALSHSKGVLHRDIKPENIIVGQYGEVMILDWGLAKLIHSKDEEDSVEVTLNPFHSLTNAGKVVGTLSYMAPERALGAQATFQTDIYALGVILYQILTLQLPFKRKSLKEYPKVAAKEKLIPPEEAAPYRDVPKVLSNILLKCLDKDPHKRFQTVDELIHELDNFIEGRSEWFLTAHLDIFKKEDWKFQEHILLAEHAAITRHTEEFGWVNLMLSKQQFMGHTKIEVDVRLQEGSQGVGFLIGVAEESVGDLLSEGYCLFISSDLTKQTKLMRSAVEVYHAPDHYLKRGQWYHLRIEKIDHSLYYFVDGKLQFSYISHQPLLGPHIGVLLKDAHLEMQNFIVYEAGQNVMVNCLAVPDAFFTYGDLPQALKEYRRIGQSFPGRAEGREAMFRAGVTLLEQAAQADSDEERSHLLNLSFDEFEKLHLTPGAPLEYLGKALIYEELGEFEEEVKCFELASRRYPHHPLLPLLEEQIIYRMHESSMVNRLATYLFILLVLRQLPDIAATSHAKKLFMNVQKHWEELPFIEPLDLDETKFSTERFAVEIAYNVNKPYTLCEIIETLSLNSSPPWTLIGNALFALIEMGAFDLAREKIDIIDSPSPHWNTIKERALAAMSQNPYETLTHLQDIPSFEEPTLQRTILKLLKRLIETQETDKALKIIQKLKGESLPKIFHHRIENLEVVCLLYQNEVAKASEILHQYPLEILTREKSILHFLFGLILFATEGETLSSLHFQGTLEVPYPRSWTLGSHYLSDKIDLQDRWGLNAFEWEKRELYGQLALYSHCKGEKEEEIFWRQKLLDNYYDNSCKRVQGSDGDSSSSDSTFIS